jgi:polyisoprenoid-binding protein YceI
MRFSARGFALFGALALVAVPALAAARLTTSSGMESRFIAVGPAGLKIEGTTKDGSVSDDGKTIRVTVPLGNITTGISLRDRHMRDKYLQTASYPEASLEVARSALSFPKPGAEASSDVAAQVRLHGQSKTVTVHYTAKRDGSSATLHVSGTMHLNMVDFGIEAPKYMGLTVKPEVDVSVRFDAAER